jgi:hypothetical protein
MAMQIAVRAKRQVAAIVIGAWLKNVIEAGRPLQIEPRTGIGHCGIARTQKTRDDGITRKVGKVDIEPAARRVVRSNGHPEQTTFLPPPGAYSLKSRKSVARTTPLWMTRIRPPCSTTNCLELLVGS